MNLQRSVDSIREKIMMLYKSNPNFFKLVVLQATVLFYIRYYNHFLIKTCWIGLKVIYYCVCFQRTIRQSVLRHFQ